MSQIVTPIIGIAPGLEWRAHHDVNEQTGQIDGALGPCSLDIWYVDADENDELRAAYPTASNEANSVWQQGSVLFYRLWSSEDFRGNPALLVPGKHFTESSLFEALKRYRP